MATVSSRQDFEELLEALLPSAQEALRRQGELFPFDGVVQTDGQVVVQKPPAAAEDLPACEEQVEQLKEALRRDRSAYRATGLCYDARVSLPGSRKLTDAIMVNLDHVDGHSIRVCLPYKNTKDSGLIFGDLLEFEGEGDVFA